MQERADLSLSHGRKMAASQGIEERRLSDARNAFNQQRVEASEWAEA
jgi:hypothetical protein